MQYIKWKIRVHSLIYSHCTSYTVSFNGSEKIHELFSPDWFIHRFVQFFLRLGCGKASPDPRSQPVLLQFSVNGGLSWNLLQKFFYTNSSNLAELVALEIPLQARTTETRLHWWQPSANGYFHSPWVIDKVKWFQPNTKHLSIMFYIYFGASSKSY